MRRIDGNQFARQTMGPLYAFAAAGKNERIHLTIFNDAELQVAFVRRCRYGMPFVQCSTPLIATPRIAAKSLIELSHPRLIALS